MKKSFFQGPIRKNILTLWAKYYADEILGKNVFIHSGEKITTITPASNEKPLTILFPTAYYLDRGLAWQSTIAKAFSARGHKVIFMPLDLHFPSRNALYADDQDWGFITTFYNLYTNTLLRGFHFSIQPYSSYGSTSSFSQYRSEVQHCTFEDCLAYVGNNLPLGRLSQNSLIHHFRCSTTTRSNELTNAYRDYIAMSRTLSEIIRLAYDQIKPDLIFALNGSFVDSGLHLAIAKERSIPCVTFEAGFMLNSLMIGINEPIITFPMSKYLPAGWEEYKLTGSQNEQLDRYLDARSKGKESVFDYWGKPLFDLEAIRHELGLLPATQPDILFTNLLWDSSTIDCDVAWSSQIEWISDTIRWYAEHPDRTLLVRIHPAEVVPAALQTTDPIANSIHKQWPKLPSNVIFIPPTSTISSFPLTQLSNLTLVYASTAGLEAAIMGKTVLVAGKTHYRDQKFVHSISTKKEYEDFLSATQTSSPNDRSQTLARSYAYFFFFGFNLPFPLVREQPTNVAGPAVQFMFSSEAELLPGKNADLDQILDLILQKTTYHDRFRTMMTPL